MNHKNYKNDIIENIIMIILLVLLSPIFIVVNLLKMNSKNGKIL